MGYFWQSAPAVEVTLGVKGEVVGFEWEGFYHPIKRLLGYWREDTGWWRWRVWRDYYQIATRTGRVVELYQDLRLHTWHVQRIYD